MTYFAGPAGVVPAMYEVSRQADRGGQLPDVIFFGLISVAMFSFSVWYLVRGRK